MVRIADTSALYAGFSVSDIHHEEASAALRDPEPVIVPSEIYAETIALVHLRHGHGTAVAAGTALRELPHVDVEASTEALVRAAWTVFVDAGGSLSYPDAIVVARCRRHGVAPFAYDADLVEWATNG